MPTPARLPDGKGRHFFKANALFDAAKSQFCAYLRAPKRVAYNSPVRVAEQSEDT